MAKIYYAITPKFFDEAKPTPLPVVTRYVSEKEPHYRVAELLETHGLADTQEAIEASSWCELAEIGEVYEGEHFTIEIIEDEED